MSIVRLTAVILLSFLGQIAFAGTPANEGLALTPETAGPEFKIQGEYEGELTAGDGTKSKFGAQVIALGGTNFNAKLESGGLPGAGWDMKSFEIKGTSEGDKATFNGPGDGKTWTISIAAETLTGSSDKGDKLALKKVMRQSPTLGLKPPEGAVVLFDGTINEFNGKIDERGFLKAGATSKKKFDSYTLHIEFLLPFKPNGRGQDRGNSGVYQQGRYEVQVLDSFGLKGENNECGGVYTVAKPKVNMCFPPLTWQTYDIEFTGAKFDESGKKIANAKMTCKHNGVVIHEDLDIPKETGGGSKEVPGGGPFHLQDHGNPVFYRNIWVVEKK
ncbi:MAG TPA: DUF1080 domain-containing protein [Planctomycetota bacterium]|nr:DUF1080 domain-containing protein [Planctomycetota bacterium]